jgi:hypothetical protein
MTKFLLDEDPQDGNFEEGSGGFFNNTKLIVALVFCLVFGGSTLASNFSISGSRIEYGQGLFKVTACDSWISVGLFPTAATYGGYSKIQSVELVGLDPQKCAGKILRFKFYGETSTAPLKMYIGAIETTTASATTPTIDSATTLAVLDTTTAFTSGTYANYAMKALTLVDQSNVNIGYSNDYLSISYNKSTGSWKIYMFQPLCFIRDVYRVTVESALPGA